MNIIITGATKGIGKAIATKFVHHNYNLVLCSRTRDDLILCKENLLQLNNSIKIYIGVMDAKSNKSIDEFGQFVLDSVDSIDVLVNNVGQFEMANIANADEGQLENMLQTNLFCAYHLTRKLLPKMMSKKKGHIINMCSVASIMAYPNSSLYSISKFALLGFSKSLRNELREFNIKVTSILPGATWSNSWVNSGYDESAMMKSEDIAEMIWQVVHLSKNAVVEDIILRPINGDI